MCGRRIRLYYKGIQKKCGKCFGNHRNSECDQERVPWINYVRDFKADHPEVPEVFYGRWMKILKEEEEQGNMKSTNKIKTRRQLRWWEEEDEEMTAQVTETVEEEEDDESEKEQETPCTYTKEQIEHSQRVCQLGGMPEETIEMLGTLIRSHNKVVTPHTKKPEKKATEATGANATTIAAGQKSKREQVKEANNKDELEAQKTSGERSKRQGGGKKGKTYL
jgi:hypothetical protein